jgi:hypothetical protein
MLMIFGGTQSTIGLFTGNCIIYRKIIDGRHRKVTERPRPFEGLGVRKQMKINPGKIKQ